MEANAAMLEDALTMKPFFFMLYLKVIKATQMEW